MRDSPDSTFLLDLAEDEPDADLRAHCHAIAAREADGAAGYHAIRAELMSLYGKVPDSVLLQRLAADIRAGRFDAAGRQRDRIVALLRDLAAQKLRESRPEFLRSESNRAKM